MKPKHRTGLMQLIPKDGVGAEIGVCRGHFSKIIMREAEPCVLYLVDLWERREGVRMPGQWTDEFHRAALHETMTSMREHIAKGVVRPLCGESVDIASRFPDRYLDWVYIDACHTYEACKADLDAWSPKVKHGGYIMGHDYARTIRWAEGVIRAVTEFANAHRVNVEVTDERKASFWFKKTWGD